MSIEYRGDNKYRFRVRKDAVNYTQNYYCEKKLSEKDLQEKKWPKEVNDEHKKFEVNILSGNVGINENMKFYELAQLVMDQYVKPHLRGSTQASYFTVYNNYALPEFGNMKISKIKPLHIQKLINSLIDKQAPNTIYTTLSRIKTTFNKAVEWQFIKQNPCVKISIPKIEKTNYNELMSGKDISKLFTIYEKMPSSIHKLAFFLAIGCGLRGGEIRALEISDFDFKKNTVRINKQSGLKLEGIKRIGIITEVKTESSNGEVYMPSFVSDVAKEFIDNMKLIPASKQLFYNPDTGKPILETCLTRQFNRVLEENNIKKIRFHDLRHLQATMLVNAGVNLAIVSKRLRHANVKTTANIYTHVIGEIERESTKQLENFVDKLRAN